MAEEAKPLVEKPPWKILYSWEERYGFCATLLQWKLHAWTKQRMVRAFKRDLVVVAAANWKQAYPGAHEEVEDSWKMKSIVEDFANRVDLRGP